MRYLLLADYKKTKNRKKEDKDDKTLDLNNIIAEPADSKKQKYDLTPLMAACVTKNSDIVNMLLSYRNAAEDFACNVNAINQKKETALHAAAASGELKIVTQLLQRPDIKPRLGAVYYALNKSHFIIADIIFNDPRMRNQRYLLGGFLLLVGAAILGSVYPSHGAIGAAGLIPLVIFLLSLILHQLLKCCYQQEYHSLTQLMPNKGTNNFLGEEEFLPEDEKILSGREKVEEIKNDDIEYSAHRTTQALEEKDQGENETESEDDNETKDSPAKQLKRKKSDENEEVSHLLTLPGSTGSIPFKS